jgi:hypothetical protein
MLSNVATIKRDKVPTNSNQTNIQPVFDVYAGVQGRDLSSVAADINEVKTELQKEMKPGNNIEVVGQIRSMNHSFRNLGIGLLLPPCWSIYSWWSTNRTSNHHALVWRFRSPSSHGWSWATQLGHWQHADAAPSNNWRCQKKPPKQGG